MRCLEAMCREKYLNFDPCSVTAEDVKRGPGWMQPDKAYAKCLKDGFAKDSGAGTSLPVGSVRIWSIRLGCFLSRISLLNAPEFICVSVDAYSRYKAQALRLPSRHLSFLFLRPASSAVLIR